MKTIKELEEQLNAIKHMKDKHLKEYIKVQATTLKDVLGLIDELSYLGLDAGVNQRIDVKELKARITGEK